MVQLDDREVLGQERHRPQDAGAERGMLFDQLELLGRQRVRLAQHVVADADLADVVEQRAKPQHVELLGGRRICRPIATEMALTRSEWPAV